MSIWFLDGHAHISSGRGLLVHAHIFSAQAEKLQVDLELLKARLRQAEDERQDALNDLKDCQHSREAALKRLEILEQSRSGEALHAEQALNEAKMEALKAAQALDSLRTQFEADVKERTVLEEARKCVLLQEKEQRGIAEEERRRATLSRVHLRWRGRRLFKAVATWSQHVALQLKARELCDRMMRSVQRAAMRRCFNGFCERVEWSKEMTRMAASVLTKWRAPTAVELCRHAWNDWILSGVYEKEYESACRAQEAEGKLEEKNAALEDARLQSATALEKSAQDLIALMGKLDVVERQQQSLRAQLLAAVADRESAMLQLEELRKEAGKSEGRGDDDDDDAFREEQMSVLRAERDDLKLQLEHVTGSLEDATIQARSCEAEKDMAMAQLATVTEVLEELSQYLPVDAV